MFVNNKQRKKNMASNNLNKLILNVLRLTDYLSYLYNVRIPNNRSSSPYLRESNKSFILSL